MSIAEILEKALLNTLLGMGTVFIMLIFIAWIISMLKYIPGLIEKMTGKKTVEEPKKAPAPEPAPVPVPAVETVLEEEVDLELVAVITAAVAASMGTESTDGFVVRSIKRAKNRKW